MRLPWPPPALPAAACAGAYRDELFGAIEIAGTDVGLVLKLGPKPGSFALLHFDRDLFTYQQVGENADG
ncbi:MAG TPA: serine hydrolase, partial [Casimicrobiaceae bacterium]|nr:serine hydrolase [Casimicrobiaceae bacterium]